MRARRTLRIGEGVSEIIQTGPESRTDNFGHTGRQFASAQESVFSHTLLILKILDEDGKWADACRISGDVCTQESLQMRRKDRGFSLIELLIVVAIILIVAAVAVPNLVRSRMSANEASAVASMRTVITSEIVYSSTYANGFSSNLLSLSDGGTATNCIPPAVASATAACLLDSNVASGTKNGYIFTYAPSGSGTFDTYTLNGDPGTPGAGQRHFYSDQTNVLRVNNAAVASSTDPAL